MANFNEHLSSVIFDTQAEADEAVRQLRVSGAQDENISIVARDDGETTTTDGAGVEATKDILGKGAAGAGVGALLGVAALAIPGVGPFVAAGAIASAAVGGAALTGTAIGAAAGALAGALEDHGVAKEDADYYEKRLNDGGVFVSVDTKGTPMTRQQANEVLTRANGHSKTLPRTA